MSVRWVHPSVDDRSSFRRYRERYFSVALFRIFSFGADIFDFVCIAKVIRNEVDEVDATKLER